MTLAAHANAKTMYLGVKGGLNIGSLTGESSSPVAPASLTGEDPDNLDSHNGFIGGAFYGIDFTDDFGLRIEGLYVMGGAEGPYNTQDGDTHEAIIKLDYIQFPLLFVVNIPATEQLTFDVTLGPTFSFNTTAEAEIPEHNETEDISNIAGFEFGAAIGAGVEYKLSSMSILVDARYYAGATSVIDVGQSDVKNRGIGIMAGVKFPLGAK
jgi:opacity protein-like surface antigen